jgi:hypothetical protein
VSGVVEVGNARPLAVEPGRDRELVRSRRDLDQRLIPGAALGRPGQPVLDRLSRLGDHLREQLASALVAVVDERVLGVLDAALSPGDQRVEVVGADQLVDLGGDLARRRPWPRDAGIRELAASVARPLPKLVPKLLDLGAVLVCRCLACSCSACASSSASSSSRSRSLALALVARVAVVVIQSSFGSGIRKIRRRRGDGLNAVERGQPARASPSDCANPERGASRARGPGGSIRASADSRSGEAFEIATARSVIADHPHRAGSACPRSRAAPARTPSAARTRRGSSAGGRAWRGTTAWTTVLDRSSVLVVTACASWVLLPVPACCVPARSFCADQAL